MEALLLDDAEPSDSPLTLPPLLSTCQDPSACLRDPLGGIRFQRPFHVARPCVKRPGDGRRKSCRSQGQRNLSRLYNIQICAQ